MFPVLGLRNEQAYDPLQLSFGCGQEIPAGISKLTLYRGQIGHRRIDWAEAVAKLSSIPGAQSSPHLIR
jgi:hypothetical protein